MRKTFYCHDCGQWHHRGSAKCKKTMLAHAELTQRLNGFDLFLTNGRERIERKNLGWEMYKRTDRPLSVRAVGAMLVIGCWHARDVVFYFLDRRQKPALSDYILRYTVQEPKFDREVREFILSNVLPQMR